MMKRLLSIISIGLLISFQVSAQDYVEPDFVPGDLIVQIMPDGSIEKIIEDNSELNGQPTNLRLNRLLSAPMYAYLLTFDESVDAFDLRDQVNRHKDISLVQFNHYVQQRILPNDPQLNQQWWHTNIDSDEAWDITTGGLTALGDTIVVCVVDDGGDLDHPDLIANNWINHQEIPNNNFDDDDNGYVDDYEGWNPVNDNDNVDGGSHGVSVAGMVGAVGDNNEGVVGVNWNVKIMNMTYGGTQEAAVIEAYTYPLVMRRMYNESGGDKGAFVVATNSSWGIDNGNPASAPLWCAFYDTLGAAGILSCGATANNNVNIDQVGDLPTGCDSEYMLSITATNNNDVRTFSGYGATTVDLGAPGEDVRTTAGGGGYTTTSGTSFASPATAGAIALVYSAPCASLAQIAQADPPLAAEMVRDAIFNGVDPIANLNGECVTGGRLNTKNAIDEILGNCPSAGCLPPFNVAAINLTDVSAQIDWSGFGGQTEFNIAFGVSGMAGLVDDDVTAPYSMWGLTPCTEYWVALQADCDTMLSDWSDTLYFTTDGCCEPPIGINASNITVSDADVSWNSVLAANSYNLRIREVGGGAWTEENNIAGTTTSVDLEECVEYEVQISTNCDGNVTTDYSDPYYFTSAGCGACVEENYCESSANNAEDDWIDQVEFNTLDNTSGSDGGYADYTNLSTTVVIGETYDLTLTPDYDFWFVPGVTFNAWIDFDHNGNFTNADKVIDGEATNADVAITMPVTIPLDAVLGSTRMRIKMSEGSNGNACQPSFNYGEVEDYCVMIMDTATGIRDLNSGELRFGMYPNPTEDQVTINLGASLTNVVVTVSDIQGRVLIQRTESATRRLSLDVSALAAGIYLVNTTDSSGKTGTKKLTVR